MKTFRLPVLIVCSVASLVAGTVVVERAAINRLLSQDAGREAEAWTDFLVKNLTSLPAFLATGNIDKQTVQFINQVKPASRVFLFKVYAADGRVVYYSSPASVTLTDLGGLSTHNEEAAEAIEAGHTLTEEKFGTPPERPAFYSEAYVPLRDRMGRTIGVVESYIDQTEKRANFHETFFYSALALSILVVLAFGIPAIGWYRLDRGRERSDARFRYVASHDPLLGLINRSEAVTQLDALLADERDGRHLAIHKIDIDRFKDINGRLGLEAGDEFLKGFAARLRQLVHTDDVLARIAGNEFLIIQLSASDAQSAAAFGRLLVHQMARPIPVHGEDVVATVCVGTALAPEHGTSAERLMRNAKLALGHAKTLGRGQFVMFRPDFDDELRRHLKVERAINNALANKGFTIHFQPLYGVKEGTLLGFEALARLQTETDGFISPAEFIPAAERMGVIDQIGAFMIETAAAAASNWPINLTVAVNLSPAQFHSGPVASIVAEALKNTGLDPRRLSLEITESLLLEDRADVMRQLRELKDLGTSIVMDDFGIGYSSLSYLWRFPFDKIKIDASFMRGIAEGEDIASKVVQSITALGHALGMRVCVEGVETKQQADFASAIGCDEVQGYYYARPAPMVDVPGLVLSDFARRLPKSSESDAGKVRAAGKNARG